MSNCNHEWRYNFPSIPNKRICTKCKVKHKLDLEELEWYETSFKTEGRSDEELIKDWVK